MFQQMLLDSNKAVWVMAQHYQHEGRQVTVFPQFCAPTVEQAADYVDNGDLYIGTRAEVRHIQHDFTSYQDFPYEFVIVGNKIYDDNARPKPFVYNIVNRKMTHFAKIFGATRPHWIVMEVCDRRNTLRDVYFCPREHVTFHEIHTTR